MGSLSSYWHYRVYKSNTRHYVEIITKNPDILKHHCKEEPVHYERQAHSTVSGEVKQDKYDVNCFWSIGGSLNASVKANPQ